YKDFATRTQQRQVKLQHIIDGTSNTLLMSEALMHDDSAYDWRGDMLNDDEQCGRFMTINTPNNGIDEISFSTYCQSTPKLPCTVRLNGRVTARSGHRNGVNVSLADGSVRFVSNSIPLTVWQAVSTINGRETVSLTD